MRLLQVNLGDLNVLLNHLQAGVAEQRLKRKNFPVRAQIADGKSVPEAMQMAFPHFSLFTYQAN